ncbi:squalene monooxygenase [Microthyrium microscopicum]|uniref:Squalene monooxygenase n=1 Tax=Microthyrium microscopicum TaxID=703497 RepID=A0A6A6UWV8_9PEZI|nr:squalene monooxygenase [Microthyrium microscopicum]
MHTSTEVDFRSRNDELEKLRMNHHEADIVIVGAGIAGCALAVAFGKQGRSVVLLERSLKEPDRIVGELLQPGGVRALEKLGLRDCLEGIDSIPCHGYEVIYHQNPVHIPYPPYMVSESGEAPEGRSFHHGRLIANLREAAHNTANVTVIESTVTSLVNDEYTGQILGVQCKTAGAKDCFFGSLTIIADGSSSNFRKFHSKDAPVVRSRFWALEMIDPVLPRKYHGHVLLGDFSPILIYQIGTHETRILVDIPLDSPTATPKAGGVPNHMREVVLPVLPDGVKESFSKALEAGNLRSMPNQWLPPRTNKLPGALFIGDAFNMRHPLTGGGMTCAFNDAVLLSNLLSPQNVPSLNNTKLVLKQLKTFHWKRKDVTAVINILAQALYSLFAANDDNLRALQAGCFQYFKLGGNCVDGPCGLLAGIIRNPLVLIGHFFAVAVYAIWIDARKYPTILLPFTLLIRGVVLLYTACVVIFPYIFAELRS